MSNLRNFNNVDEFCCSVVMNVVLSISFCFICLSNTLCNKLHFQQYWSSGTIRFREGTFLTKFPDQ